MSTRGYKTLVAVVTLLTSLSTKAQFRHFNKMYNHKGWWDNAVGVVDLGNHYLVAGTTADLLSPDSSYYRSLWLYYLDSAGNKGMERLIHFPYQFAGVGPVGAGRNFLTKASEGKYLFTGTLSDTNQNARILLLELDSSLQPLWITIDSTKGYMLPYDATKLLDGGYMVCGYSGENFAGKLEGFLARYDQWGNRIWVKQYYGIGNTGFSSIILFDSSSLLTTRTYSQSGSKTSILKIDTSGTIIWSKETNISNVSFNIKKSTDSTYIIYGVAGKTNNIYGLVGKFKLNNEVGLMWADSFRLARFSHFIDVFELPGGNIIAVGETDNVNAFNGTTIAWSVKVSSNGQYLRERLYLYEDGRPSHMWSASSTSDGGIICVGTAQNDYEPSPYGQDAWVMKIDTNLCDTPGCGGIIIGTTADEEFKTNDVKVYPNPFNHDFEVAYHTGNLQGVTVLRIYNLQGLLVKEVALDNVNEGNLSISMATCSPGLYLVQLVNNGSILKTQKLLKQR